MSQQKIIALTKGKKGVRVVGSLGLASRWLVYLANEIVRGNRVLLGCAGDYMHAAAIVETGMSMRALWGGFIG